MNHDPELLERAQLGKQIEAFWSSDVGTYLRNRAAELYTTAIANLKECDPTDWRKVAEYQQDAFKGESFITWLEEGINDGLQALELLESGDNE